MSGGATSDVVWRALAEIADISTGSSNTDDAVEGGCYPFFVRSQQPLAKDEYEYDEEAIITAGDGVGVGKVFLILSILVDTFISKISLPMQPVPEIGSISVA